MAEKKTTIQHQTMQLIHHVPFTDHQRELYLIIKEYSLDYYLRTVLSGETTYSGMARCSYEKLQHLWHERCLVGKFLRHQASRKI